MVSNTAVAICSLVALVMLWTSVEKVAMEIDKLNDKMDAGVQAINEYTIRTTVTKSTIMHEPITSTPSCQRCHKRTMK